MKYLFLVSLSLNCFAQEIINECNQTKDQWTYEIIRCLSIEENEVIESGFDLETGEPEMYYNVMTIEELQEQWEKID